jgi:NADH-dependent peroxiredoxin subunit F
MEVVIYTMEGCPFCEKAKTFLQLHGINFKEIETSFGSQEWKEMKERSGSGSFPQILLNDRPVGGYSDLVCLEATGELYKRLGIQKGEEKSSLYDVIIIGAGPAGLSAAIYAIRKLLKTVIISKDVGGQVSWTNDVENYLGFTHVNAAELVAKFEEHVRKFGVEKVIGVEVSSVDLTGRIKRVITDDGMTYFGKTLIIATGGRHKPLNIPGEAELVAKGVSYCSTCDAPLFSGADVAVIGGGNSALEAVLDLINIGNKIYMVSMTPLTGDAVYQGKVKQAQNVELLIEYMPVKILGETSVQGLEVRSLKTGEERVMSVEGVFVEIGILPSSSLFIDTLATNQKGEILVDAECRTGLAGVFACGDVTNVPYKQVVVAVGEGSKAALSAYNYLLNQK